MKKIIKIYLFFLMFISIFIYTDFKIYIKIFIEMLIFVGLFLNKPKLSKSILFLLINYIFFVIFLYGSLFYNSDYFVFYENHDLLRNYLASLLILLNFYVILNLSNTFFTKFDLLIYFFNAVIRIGVVIIIIAVIYNVIFLPINYRFGLPDLQGFFYNTNSFGSFILVILINSTLYAFYYRQKKYKLISILLFLLLVLSFTRSAILSYFIGIMIYLFFYKKITIKRFFIFSSILLVSIGIFIIMENYIILLATQGGKSFSRATIWYYALEAIKASPYFGYGFGNEVEILKYFYHSYLEPGYGKAPHNTYINVFLQAGLFGFIFYLLITVYPILKIMKVKTFGNEKYKFYKYLIIINLLSLLIANIFEIRTIGTPSFFSFYYIILSVISIKYKNIIQKEKNAI